MKMDTEGNGWQDVLEVLHNIWKSGEVVTENQEDMHPARRFTWPSPSPRRSAMVSMSSANTKMEKEQTSRSNLDHSWLIGQDIRLQHTSGQYLQCHVCITIWYHNILRNVYSLLKDRVGRTLLHCE